MALGTIEPRKNHAACVAVAAALNALGWPTELHIVGRIGWGRHAFVDHPPPFLKLHGYLDAEAARAVIQSADALISMSHAEGLGLPLLEVQHGGLPVIAPDDPVFREVLGVSALLVRRDDPGSAAAAIAAAFSRRARLAADGRQRSTTSCAGTPWPETMRGCFAPSWTTAVKSTTPTDARP